ncbi:mucin-5AC isoform X5 [Drosophila mojavensis]|uniref:Uncharacterized protein, isoform C n=1 Tax=Drosophila mojavensis TaxID=7230 RepID=A0A0Q9X9S5_DROMO|nr:mucin-5AC isoform X5 [Drosophila mojavensis]KRG04957.1 uncharacterized protein Dmoj_GI20755, isoform C [Drosophila mojavensis]
MQTRSLKYGLRSRRAAGVTVTLLLALALLRIDAATGRPDVRQSPFSLELQPPLAEAAAGDAFNAGSERATDSYGNPIDALRPIDTPDGRKVVSAQGLQFEIPNYASGITEIRKPADDLLPPHIAPPSVEPNPFDSSTLPPWLQDFDYPDVGPGVPYDPENFKDVPETKPGGIKPNDFQPHGFASRSQSSDAATTTTTTSVPTASTTTTATTTTTTVANTANTAFPSKVTLTLPASSSSDGHGLNTVEPPLVLMPPVASSDDSSSTLSSPAATGLTQDPTTNSLTHFAERFAAPPVGQITETKSAAAAAAEQQFPPFSAASAGDIPKVEYTKSDGGKVISTPINVQRPEPAVVSTTSASATNTGKYTGGFGAPAGLLRPLTGTKPDIYVAGNNHEYSTRVKANRVRPGAATETATAGNGGRYTGGFGAPSGVLSPQNVPRPFQQSQQSQQSSSQPSHLAGAASSHHQSRFGGPPGILVPFDNVPRTGAK